MLRHRRNADILSRRNFMTGTAASLAAASQAQAQPAKETAPKGPPVWLDMDQKALDDAYDQSKYAPNIRQIVARYRTNSDLTRARLGAPKRLSYGSKVYLRSWHGNVGILNVDTDRAYAAVERAIIDFDGFDMRITDRQGDRITVDVNH